VLPRRLSCLATIAVLALAACGGDDDGGGAIRENVVEPGLAAIDESEVRACEIEASSFRTALEVYELTTGEPAANEAALIDAGQLREPSELWDVVDGRLVAQDSACGDVTASVPTDDIVTDTTGSAPTADDVRASFTTDDIALVGGEECAWQLAVVIAGAASFTEREGVEPQTFADAETDFEQPVTLWELVDDTLRPAAASGCTDFAAVDDS